MSVKTSLQPGAQVAWYRLTERIGRGGFAEVWSAWDTRLNRVVAVKIMPHREDSELSTAQFVRESRLIAALEYPHILPLFDFGEIPGYHFLVMRYVTGGTLAQRLEREHLLPIGETLNLMSVLAATLDFIHEQKVIHRDLKPGNVLLDAQGIPYLADFGLARALPRPEISDHTIAGTFAYMSPEQLSGAPISTSTDLFSFGILLHLLFAGELPYNGEFSHGAKLLAGAEALPDVTAINPRLPPELNVCLRQLTHFDPMQRPASAGSAAQSIAALFSAGERPSWSGLLGTRAYYERETQTLVGRALGAWRAGDFALSLTEFIVLNEMLRESPSLVTPEVCGLMLRGALQFQQDIEAWWGRAPDDQRQRACWHALTDAAPALRAMALAAPMPWAADIEPGQLDSAVSRLDPTSSEVAETALTFLERAISLPTGERGDTSWAAVNLPHTARYLSAVASGDLPQAARAAALIGKARMTSAFNTLLGNPVARPTLIALEAARGFPPGVPLSRRGRLMARLAVWQLTREPTQALYQFLWTVAGCVLAMGLMIYALWRSPDLFGTARMFNTLGLGLLFGLINGIGVWLSRHLADRLRLIPFAVRAGLGTVLGGLVVGRGFTLLHELFYQGELTAGIALGSGLAFVAGFALTVKLPTLPQILIGAGGVLAAYLVPWFIYASQLDFITPPFYFDEANPGGSILLAAVASALLATLTLGHRWSARTRALPLPATEPPRQGVSPARETALDATIIMPDTDEKQPKETAAAPEPETEARSNTRQEADSDFSQPAP